SNSHGLPLRLDSIDGSTCDSQSDIGLDAVALDDAVRDLYERTSAPVTLIANSMGGAIVRAYLAYASDAATGTLEHVDSVVMLQGAQQGSWIAHSKPVILGLMGPDTPGRAIMFAGISEFVRTHWQFDPNRPAIDGLRP